MKELTLQMLKDMKQGVFAQGETVDSPEGINMSNSGKMLKWVATRGNIYDWTIYTLFATRSYEYIEHYGDKIHDSGNIRKVVPCTDEAFEMYRY